MSPNLAVVVVPNVQEVVRSNPLPVPEKFLRIRNEEEDQPKIHLSSQIPIIDLSLLSTGHKEELNKLDQACQQWGFFQVVNHGVATEVLQEMKDATAKFFELPLEEKNKIRLPSGDGFEGYGHAYVVLEGQTMDWSDALRLTITPAQSRNLKFWPTEPNGFKEAVEAYSSEIRRVGEELLMSLSILVGMDKDTLLGLHKELFQSLKVNYVPPCSMPDKVLGLSPHSDRSTITVLMQDDNVIGLHIRKEGEWVPVKPIPNSLVVNVGDVIEILSNGKYKSIEHRVVPNESKARTSFATFLSPRLDVEVEPFDHMVESSRLYKKVTYGDYLKASLKVKRKGKAHIEAVKIRS